MDLQCTNGVIYIHLRYHSATCDQVIDSALTNNLGCVDCGFFQASIVGEVAVRNMILLRPGISVANFSFVAALLRTRPMTRFCSYSEICLASSNFRPLWLTIATYQKREDYAYINTFRDTAYNINRHSQSV